ncbi:MAG: TonB-dependent receptor [Gammaproteobacteria bacterium]|nr:TonB-dependent receptor [Gammaproteobacteria bacterium]
MRIALYKTLRILTLPAIVGLAISCPIYAADEIEEIIVTATKRNETIFDVPVAVTAVSGEDLEQAGVRDITDLQTVAPALTFSQSTGGLQSVFAIRGIGTAGNNTGLEQSVGVVIDGVFRGRPGSALNDYIDISQIEVLRGPQGTIFGKNTSAGVINVRTAKPSYEPKVLADLTLGDYGLWHARSSISGGSEDDNVAFSLAGSVQNRDGYIDNLVNGDSLNDRDRWSVRAQMLWEPTDDISLRMIGDISKAEEKCCVAVPVLYGPASGAIQAVGGSLVPNTPGTLGDYTGGIANLEAREVYVNPEQPYIDPLDDKGLSAELEWDLGTVTATGIAAFRTFESLPNIDADFTSANIFDSVIGQDLEETSLEVRFASNGDNMLDWLVGGYYFDQHINADNYLGFGSDTRPYVGFVTPSTANPFTGGMTQINVVDLVEILTSNAPGTFFASGQASTDKYAYENGSYAFFGNATWHASDRMDLTAGMRYTKEDKEAWYVIDSTDPFSQLPLNVIAGGAFAALSSLQTSPAVDPFYVDFEDDNVSIALSASFEVNDQLNTYLRYSEGYKSGGFNLNRNGPNTAPGTPDRVANYADLVAANPQLTPLQSLQDAVTFQPETVDAIEFGFKSRALDGRLKLDGTFFIQNLENFQANSFNGTVFTIRNAGELEGKGLELDYSYDFNDNFSTSGGATFQDIEYASFTGASATATQNAMGMPTQDLSGAKPNFVSDVILTGSFNYMRPLANNREFMARLGYRYRSDYTTGQDNDSITLQDSYTKWDASIGLLSAEGKWAFELWGRNITDETVSNIVFDTPLQAGSFSAFLEAPRTYGLTIRYKN